MDTPAFSLDQSTDPKVQAILAAVRARTGSAPSPLPVAAQGAAQDAAANAAPLIPAAPEPVQAAQPLAPPPAPTGPIADAAAQAASAAPSFNSIAAPNTGGAVPASGPGPVKSTLHNVLFGALHGAGDAIRKNAGLETSAEEQQRLFNQNITTQSQQRLNQLGDAQIAKLQAETDARNAALEDVDLDPAVAAKFGFDPTKQVPRALAQALSTTYAKNQGKTEVAEINIGAGTVPLSPQLAERAGLPQLANKPVSGKFLTSIVKMLGGEAAGITTGDIGGGHTGLIDKITKKPIQDFGVSSRILGTEIAGENHTVQVVDPTNPNSTVQMSPAKANRLGAQGTQSIDYATSKSVSKDFTTGKAAQNLNAFNTAQAHLHQLGTAADALENGNLQLVNTIGQSYAQQTGSPVPTNFDAVKTAVAGEIGKVFKGGNATDTEIAELNANISRAQSPRQLKGVINTYTNLMQSKKDALQQQYIQGKQGKPNFAGESSGHPPPGMTHIVIGSDKQRHYTNAQGTVDGGLVP